MATVRMIKNAEMLDRFIPNVLVSVKGEKSLFDKLDMHLLIAETWLKDTFTSETTFSTIAGYSDDNIIKHLCCQVVVSEAFRKAVPSLDLVLTPNGFGIVSNSNVVPASKERIARLMQSLEKTRDDALELLIPKLAGASKWTSSTQCEWFRSTLFQDLSVVADMGITEHRWEKYVELRQQIIDIEQSLAEEFISPELMAVWRGTHLTNASVERAIAMVKAEILRVLKGQPISTQRMMDVVNLIRNNPLSFPAWHDSDTAKLFSPPVFKNKKQAKGYWF